jgi:hypothetical protein
MTPHTHILAGFDRIARQRPGAVKARSLIRVCVSAIEVTAETAARRGFPALIKDTSGWQASRTGELAGPARSEGGVAA